MSHNWNEFYCCRVCGFSKLMAYVLRATECSGVPERRVSREPGGVLNDERRP